MLGNRISQYNAAAVPKVNQARTTFDRSHTRKDTQYVDYLYPVYLDEILPGDTVNITMQNFSRLATSKVPLMDNLRTKVFFFFCPSRLLWTNWERFQGAQDNPGDSTDFTLPTVPITAAKATVDSLWDKFGIRGAMLGANTKSIQNLPGRMYNLTYNQWFKHQLLQDNLVVDLDNGPDDPDDYQLKKITKMHNYFTACLPEPQRGDDVTLPLGTTAPIYLTADISAGQLIKRTDTKANVPNIAALGSNASSKFYEVASGVTMALDPNGTLYTDLNAATAASVNTVREALKMQEIFELDARGGTRYVEILLNRFGVVSPDFRLQRVEFLGSGSFTLNSHVVPQTSKNDTNAPQGNLAAFGTISGSVNINKSFVEHGYIMGLAVTTGDQTFQQGLPRFLTRSTRFDFFEPKLQELGEQAVLKQELYCDGSATDDDVFGYMPRYDEYRFAPSIINGEFNSTYTTPLDQWHLAEEFGSVPSLNETFILANTPIDRNLNVSSGPDILVDMWFKVFHTRPMVAYSTPLTIGRF